MPHSPHPMPTDFRSLIDLFGGPLRLKEFLNLKRRTPYAWRERNWIPSEHWKELVRVAKECGFEGITYALLAGFPRP